MSPTPSFLIRCLGLRPLLGSGGQAFILAYPKLQLRLEPTAPWPFSVEHPTQTLPFDLVPSSPLRLEAGFEPAFGGVLYGNTTASRAILEAHASTLEELLATGGMLSGRGAHWPTLPTVAEIDRVIALVHALNTDSDNHDDRHWMEDLTRMEQGEPVHRAAFVAGRARPATLAIIKRLRSILDPSDFGRWTPELFDRLESANQLPLVEQLLSQNDPELTATLLQRMSTWPLEEQLVVAASLLAIEDQPKWCLWVLNKVWIKQRRPTDPDRRLKLTVQALRHGLALHKVEFSASIVKRLHPRKNTLTTLRGTFHTASPATRTRLWTHLLSTTDSARRILDILEIACILGTWDEVGPTLAAALDTAPLWWEHRDPTPMFLEVDGPPPADALARMSARMRTRAPSPSSEDWIQLLTRSPDPGVEAELLTWLERTDTPHVQIRLFDWLGEHGTAACIRTLRGFDGFLVNARVRRAAVAALAAIDTRFAQGGLTAVDSGGGLSSVDD